MIAEAEYDTLLARLSPRSTERRTAEQYRAQGYSLDTINDYLRPIVVDIDGFERQYDI